MEQIKHNMNFFSKSTLKIEGLSDYSYYKNYESKDTSNTCVVTIIALITLYGNSKWSVCLPHDILRSLGLGMA